MTRTSYAGNAVLIEANVQPREGGVQPVLQTAADTGRASESLQGVMQIMAPAIEGVVRATWNLLVRHHGKSAADGGFQKWFDKLHGLARLREGWDSYSAPKPSPGAIAAADLYLTTLRMLAWEPTRLDPSAMGGVGITHRVGVRKVYVEFYNDGRVHALFSDGTLTMETAPAGTDVRGFYRFIGKAREYLHG